MNKKTAKSKFSKGIRTIACFTLLVTIALSMTGCDVIDLLNNGDIFDLLNYESKKHGEVIYGNTYETFVPYDEFIGINEKGALFEKQGTNHEHFLMGEIKSRETIEKDGITVQDVLSLYDKLALDIIETDELHHENFYDLYDTVTAQFTSITVNYFIHFTDQYNYFYEPFFAKSYYYYPGNHKWFAFNGALHNESINDVEMEECVYPTTFNSDFIINNKIYSHQMEYFGIAADDFERMMDAFNIENGIIEENEINTYHPFHYNNRVGYKKYSPIIINRELIENANEEQLWALYNLVDSMYLINFEGKTPIID